MVVVLQKPHILSQMLENLTHLVNDDQDSVRLLAVESLLSVAKLFTNEETRIHLLEPLKKLCTDRSWRVRYMVAEKFVAVS
jgi:serine/threonine-protein phosphatase 2A regulatory subunit A